MKKILLLIILPYMLLANHKHLILSQGGHWSPKMVENHVKNRAYIESLPFTGYVIVGNSYTHGVMTPNRVVSYDDVWEEMKGLKNLYKIKRDNFLEIYLKFPADFWDDKAWQQVSRNFAVVAKVAQDLGFKGIIFDDEPYSKDAIKMSNFKFPNREEIAKNPLKYKNWEKSGSQPSWVDKDAYRNPQYTFKEHMAKVTMRFKDIMLAMSKVAPSLTVLVYNGPAYAHPKSYEKRIIVGVGMAREHEYKGAMFLGLKKGLRFQVTLHDMGENYRYRQKKHFDNAYNWRKYNMASNSNNDDLDANFQWTIPVEERRSWENEVNVGFMVYNKGQNSSIAEFDTRNNSSIASISKTLTYALEKSDKYVVYYTSPEQNWLIPHSKFPHKKEWKKMLEKIYKRLDYH